ncbi:hypothetical protein [Paenibacillus endoradicis]|uniref:hypothetical protein n=1 Tax=Paenibacillus endoradicis TaxID=2972487 RepID=UPI0021597A55|nr:hypothetical protein [Paenibacillus endoradicis]MCR8657437.1 hypothetical protein [Paenibacillus endoradicis]
MKVFISLFIALFILTGCNQSTVSNTEHSRTPTSIGNPSATDILAENPNADIFQYKDVIYKNASNNEWVQQAELTIGDRVLTIEKQYNNDLTFEQGMATMLPIGTEIHVPITKSGAILIAKVDGKEIRYVGLIEG